MEDLAADINGVAPGWGERVVDALKTPGAQRVRFSVTAGGQYVTWTARTDGKWVRAGVPGEAPSGLVGALMILWGTMPAGEHIDAWAAIQAGRELAGLSRLAGWELINVGYGLWVASCGPDEVAHG